MKALPSDGYREDPAAGDDSVLGERVRLTRFVYLDSCRIEALKSVVPAGEKDSGKLRSADDWDATPTSVDDGVSIGSGAANLPGVAIGRGAKTVLAPLSLAMSGLA